MLRLTNACTRQTRRVRLQKYFEIVVGADGDDFAFIADASEAEAEGARVIFGQEDEAEARVGACASLVFDDLEVEFFEVGAQEGLDVALELFGVAGSGVVLQFDPHDGVEVLDTDTNDGFSVTGVLGGVLDEFLEDGGDAAVHVECVHLAALMVGVRDIPGDQIRQKAASLPMRHEIDGRDADLEMRLGRQIFRNHFEVAVHPLNHASLRRLLMSRKPTGPSPPNRFAFCTRGTLRVLRSRATEQRPNATIPMIQKTNDVMWRGYGDRARSSSRCECRGPDRHRGL